MTLKKWLFLFWTTMVLGVISACVTGLLLILIFDEFSIVEVQQPGFNVSTISFILISGALFAMLSITGFFSYMIIRYIALGIFRKRWVWDIIQASIIIIAVIDTIYLRYLDRGANGSWSGTVWLPLFVLAVSLLVSWWKVKLTLSSAFLPTLLFMYVVTILEAVPALRTENEASSYFMLIPLLVCNAWQILLLHKIVKTKKELAG